MNTGDVGIYINKYICIYIIYVGIYLSVYYIYIYLLFLYLYLHLYLLFKRLHCPSVFPIFFLLWGNIASVLYRKNDH
jgi:hypothetical protein